MPASWDQIDPAPTAAPPPDASAVQGWDAIDPAPVALPQAPAPKPTHAVSHPTDSNFKDALNFLRTAAVKGASGVLGSIAAIPEPISAIAQGQKPIDPDAAVNHFADQGYKLTGPEYQPDSTLGKYGMAGASVALPAAVGGEGVIPNMVRGFAAGTAAQGAQDAGLPAWLGPLATIGAELFGRHVVAPAIKPSLTSGADVTAGKILNETGGVPAPSAAPALPGLRLTNGQLTGNGNALALERDVADENAPQITADNLGANQAVVNRHLDNVAPGPAGADAAVAQTGVVGTAEKAARTNERAAWDKVGSAMFDIAPLKGQLRTYVDKARAYRPFTASALPNPEIETLLSLPDHVPLETLQDARSALGEAAQTAGTSGKPLAARLAGNGEGGVGKMLEDHLSNPDNLLAATPDVMTDYNAARTATRQRYAAFGDDNKAGAQIEDLTKGKIAPESALSRFLPPGAEGNGVQSLGRLKMASGTGNGLNPARSYLVGKLKDAISGGPDAFGKVLDDYGYAFKDKDMFNPAQQGVFADARDAVDQISRKAPSGAVAGSPTLAGLQSPTFARTLYGRLIGSVAPAVSKGAGAAVGTAVAKVAPFLGDKEIAGTLFGGEAGADVFKHVSTNARNNVIRTLQQAANDPALARELQMKASAANLKMAPRMRGMMKALGLSEALVLPRTPGSDPGEVSDQ